ncbi:MAG: hypothetical protein KY439_04105 [Actinobacteria bacterium]|nr:hypothetical protein [Actinomycetota bacterium]
MVILSLIITGLIIGALGRLAIPGPNPIGILMTIIVGIGGSLAGGLIGSALGLSSGLVFVVAVLVAAGLVYLIAGQSRRGGAFGRRRGGLL